MSLNDNIEHMQQHLEGSASLLVLGNEPLLRHILTHFLGLGDQLLRVRAVSRCVDVGVGWMEYMDRWMDGWIHTYVSMCGICVHV